MEHQERLALGGEQGSACPGALGTVVVPWLCSPEGEMAPDIFPGPENQKPESKHSQSSENILKPQKSACPRAPHPDL